MNKNLIAFCDQYGLKYDNTKFYGELKGYQVSGVVNGLIMAVNVNAHVSDSAKIADWINANKRAFSINRYSVDDHGFYCEINSFSSAKKCINYLESAVDFLSSFVQPHLCPFCGNEMGEDVRLVGIGNNKMHAHENCFDSFCESVRNNEVQTAAAPNNYLKGTLGALIGCLAGAVLYVIFYSFLGLISWIAALVGSLLAAFLWDKFGGKNDKIKIVIIWVSTIVLITLAIFISFIIVVNSALAQEGLKGENAFEWFKILLQDDEFRAAVIRDTVLSYIFLIGGNVYSTVTMLRTQKLLSNTLTKY